VTLLSAVNGTITANFGINRARCALNNPTSGRRRRDRRVNRAGVACDRSLSVRRDARVALRLTRRRRQRLEIGRACKLNYLREPGAT